MRTIKFIDLFAGIGGFREGLERNGFECAGWVEVDKFKQQAYKAVHDTEGEWHKDDITTIRAEELPKADIYTGGFPCQSFSIAGNRGGFEDTRGTLFFEIARLAKERKPKYLLFENVRGLLSHDEGKTFATILKTLWEIGYNAQWQVLNSKNFGVPQNRERIFIVGYLRGEPRPKIFPFRKDSQKVNELQGQQNYTNTLTARYEANGTGSYVVEGKQYAQEIKQLNNPTHSNDRVYCEKGISPTLNTMQGGNRQPFIKKDNGIRKLTPLETFRLQGFPDEWYHKCRAAGISDTQMYRAAGDAVTVNVVQEIGRRLKTGGLNESKEKVGRGAENAKGS